MSYIKIKNFILSIVIAFTLLFIGSRCNYPETITSSNAEFILAPDSTILYRFTKMYFVIVPGDTAILCGSRSCTVTVNGIIVDSLTNDDSAYLRIITLEGVTINLDDTSHFVYPKLYQQSSTFAGINENTITRYFERTDSATLQVAFEENDIMHYTPKDRQIVMPRTLVIGYYGWYDTDSTTVPFNNKWAMSPLIRNPITLSNGSIKFDGYSVATKVICIQKGDVPYEINGFPYKNGIFIKTYYSITGEIIENNEIARIVGGIQITRTYFAERGLVEQQSISSVQKIFSNGSVEIIRERIYVARPEDAPAPQYSENEYPW